LKERSKNEPKEDDEKRKRSARVWVMALRETRGGERVYALTLERSPFYREHRRREEGEGEGGGGKEVKVKVDSVFWDGSCRSSFGR